MAEKLPARKLRQTSAFVRELVQQKLRCMSYSPKHWQPGRTNNPLERVIKKIKRGRR